MLKRTLKIFLNVIIKLFDLILGQKDNEFLSNLKEFISYLDTELIFIVEGGNWAIFWVFKAISDYLNKMELIKSIIDTNLSHPWLVRDKIIHFGSIHCLINKNKILKLHKSNKKVLTWFHFVPEHKKNRYLPILNNTLDIIHTSNSTTRTQLIQNNFKYEKIIEIPLGVDLSIFKQYEAIDRANFKKKFNLPLDALIIGSFQKDGVGWGDGLIPKLIKGPDIFCRVVKKLNKDFNIHVFLTGPARGYVKKKLDEYQIPYTHKYLKNYFDIVKCYNVLDLYIVASRIEGGPNALLEGMATGVPIVATNVGMVPKIIKHGINGLISEVEDVQTLYILSKSILKNKDLKNKLVFNGFKTAKKYNWKNLAEKYYYDIYQKFL